jgi:dTDP-4-dehydrorhamnose reductase
MHNFVHHALRSLTRSEEFAAASDATVSPTYVPDLVHAALDLLIDGEAGIWHLANAGAVTWAELAARAVRLAGISQAGLRGVHTADLNLTAVRPLASDLASERGWVMPSLDDALERFMADCEVQWASPRELTEGQAEPRPTHRAA